MRFLRRELREHSHLSDARLKVHLRRLVDLEILSALKTPSGGLSYALHYTVADRQRDVLHLNLFAAESIISNQSGKRIAPEADRIAPGSGADRGQIGGGSPPNGAHKPMKHSDIVILSPESAKQQHYGGDASGVARPETITETNALQQQRREGAA